MSDELIILGSGGSLGIPVVGCTCPVCKSSNPKNKRLRPSALFKVGGKQILIDPGPDFRQQALANGITKLDATLLTHVHYDHIAGIDELRVLYFYSKRALKCFGSIETYEEVKLRYHYLLDQTTQVIDKNQKFDFEILEGNEGSVTVAGLDWRYFSYAQAGMKVTGYRYKDLSYVTDLSDYDDTIYESLEGTKTLVLSALRFEPSPVHLSIPEAIAFAERVGAEQTYLIHIAHEIDHDTSDDLLPPNMHLAYDGLRISLS